MPATEQRLADLEHLVAKLAAELEQVRVVAKDAATMKTFTELRLQCLAELRAEEEEAKARRKTTRPPGAPDLRLVRASQ